MSGSASFNHMALKRRTSDVVALNSVSRWGTSEEIVWSNGSVSCSRDSKVLVKIQLVY